MEWFNNPVISLLTQVEYSQNNFIEKLIPLTSDAPSEDVKATTKLAHISLPLLIKLKFFEFNPNPFIFFGPKFDFIIHRKTGRCEYFHYYYRTDPLPDSQAPTRTFRSRLAELVNDTSIRGTAGIGVIISELFSKPLLFEFRFDFDFNWNTGGERVFYDPYDEYVINLKYYHYSFNTLIGLIL